MNGLAICAGIGGLELGIGIAVGESYRCVGYLERDSYAAAVLVARMEDASLDQAPIWDDLTTFDGQRWRGVVDLISAGFPCQPWSVAGKQRGIEDARWIWPEIVRIVRDVEPGFVFLENVPGLIRHGLPRVLGDPAELGFDAEWMCLAASDMGAPHVRERLFILAHSGRGAVRLDDWTEWGAGSAAGSDGKAVADAWRVGYRDVQSANDGKSGGQSVSDAAFRQARDAGDRREASGVLADAERPERRAREPGGDIADRDDAGRGEETDRAGRDCQEVGDSSGNGLRSDSSTADDRRHSPPLGRQVLKGTGPESKRSLNPLFVEWLMGLPREWTDCDASATESFRSWLRTHSGFLQDDSS